MNERDFDNIFKDNIGDELPFDFRPDDWQAAAQELDKVLPVAPTVPVITPQPRFLTWHKWAAAAAVVFVASQTWLLAKLFDLNSEIKTLKSSDNVAATIQPSTSNNVETKTIIKYDTIVRTVVIEPNTTQAGTNNAVAEATTSQKVAPNSELYKQIYKDVYRQVRKEMGNELEATKSALAAATKNTPQSQQVKTVNPDGKTSVENSVKNIAENGSKEKIKGNGGSNNNTPNTNNNLKDPNAPNNIKNEAIASQNNELPSDKTDTPNNTEKSADNLALLTAINKELGAFTSVPSIETKSVKSNFNSQLWMNEDAMEALNWAARRRTIIKPMSLPTNWTVGVNALGTWTEFPMDSSVMNKGWNVRLAYSLKNNWNITGDIDAWNETFENRDTSNRHLPQLPLPPNYVLNRTCYNASIVQIRLGADYRFINKTIFTPYVGAGLTYKKYTKKEFEYEFKTPQKDPVKFKEPFDKDKDRFFSYDSNSNPYFVSIRAGVNTNILKRLSLNTNVTGQWRMNGKSNQTWSAQVGLAYTL